LSIVTAASEDLFLYPKNGRTAEQQSVDRYECHRWPKFQTDFDATRANGAVAPAKLLKARSLPEGNDAACLAARGYSVK